MTLKVTMLGSGPSGGVPLIGCDCAVCTSTNPRNQRTRVSVVVEAPQGNLLIDLSPDLRHQALREGLRKVDAILVTHNHADHTHGIDDIRSFNYLRNAPIPIYADGVTMRGLVERFEYVFKAPIAQYGWFRPSLEPHEIVPGVPFEVLGLNVLPIRQLHGRIESLGFRIGDFAYSTDVHEMPEEAFAALEGVKVWIVDCLQAEPAPTHAHLDLALEWIERVKPERAILTHMSHTLGYEALAAALPKGVEPGFDGLHFTV